MLLLSLLTCGALFAADLEPASPQPDPERAEPTTAAWPHPAAPLRVLEPPTAEGAAGLALTIDPGHGVGTNSGNDSCLCIEEQDHNLRVASHLAASLATQGRHRVAMSRRDNAGPSYQDRIDQAAARGDALILSLHSDARGEQGSWAPTEGRACSWNDTNPGFAILWSDEGTAALVAARRALAQAIAARLIEAGFLPYDGVEYHELYQGDPAHPGVFLDRHIPSKRIRMLRRPTMPSVIIETHHAWDRREEPRWQQEPTLVAFDAAIIAALADWSTAQATGRTESNDPPPEP